MSMMKTDMIRCYCENGRCACCRLTQAVKQMPNGIEDNVMAVMTEVVTPVARAYGKEIEIMKGFSCPVFNKNEKVKDIKAQDHVKGEAVDLKAVGLEGRDLRFENVEIARVIVQTVEFDELVLEDVPADGIEPKSLHVSYRKGGKNRKVVLKHVSGKAECEELSGLDMKQLMCE